MNKTVKRLLSCVITASMLFSMAVVPSVAKAATGDPVISITFDETGTLPYALQGGASLADGRNGKALSLTTAGDQYATINSAAGEFAKLGSDYTISVWAKPESNTTWNRIYDLGSNTDNYVFLTATSDASSPRFAVKKGNELSVTAPDAVSYNEWHNFVVTRQGSLTTMYIDGFIAASTSDITYTPADIGTSSNMYLGKSQWPDPYFKGMIDDFVVYDYAINEDKIHEIAAEAYQEKRKTLIYENNCFIMDTHFYYGGNELFSLSDALSEIYVTDKNVTSSPATFTLHGAQDADISNIRAYVAVYNSNGTLKSVTEKKLTKADITSDSTDISVPFEKADGDSVKLFVWDNMKPLDSGNIDVVASVKNYTGDTADVTAKVYAVSASDGTETAIESAEVTESFKSLDEKDMSVSIPTDKIPAGTSKLIVKAEAQGEVGTAATLYKLAYAPVAAPADSNATTIGAHDPSIFKDPVSGKFYAYSSHNLVFESDDLINWTKHDYTRTVTVPASAKKIIEENISKAIANGTYWAPDIIYKENDEYPYWFYLSVSCFIDKNGNGKDDGTAGGDGAGARNSAISLVKAKSPGLWDGETKDCGVVFFTKETSSYKTNAIDANIYYDSADGGKPYFVWGSFWGGIQAAPLTADGFVEGIDYSSDAKLISSCANFGTTIYSQKSGIAGPEGAWMLEHENYRYAFTSYGWLGSNYNTRIARSPLTTKFSDNMGTQLVDANSVSMGGQYSSGSSSVPSGYKLIGSYRLGDGSYTISGNDDNYYISREAGDAHIYYGPDHNSAINVGNESFYVSHIRKDTVDVAATLQVRKMLWTSDGWPVVSPVSYAGEKEQKLPKSMIAGTYDLASVGHMKMQGSSIKARNFDLPVVSSKITLLSNGNLADGLGTWTFDGDHTVTITFAKNGDTSKDEFYKSGDVLTMYALYSYDKDEAEPVIALTGVDQNHITQFAKKSAANVYRTTPKTVTDTVPVSIDKSEGGNPALGFDDSGVAYAGDPAAFVDGDTVYMYVGHDTAETEDYEMPEWLCYSSKNMKDWKYEGVAMKATAISWRSNDSSAWASQVVKYGDKYYMYYCTWDKTSSGKQSIGVATSNSPTGPFTDPLGKPLVAGTFTTPESHTHDDIDPTILIDTDSKGVEHRYLAWGNTRYYICELDENMTSIKDLDGDGDIVMHKDVKERKIKSMGNNVYTEAPWLYKREGKYYLFFAANWREEMAYAMMDEPMGRYDYKQTIMPPTATSNTNHPAVIDFGGKTYFIYHNGMLPHGSGFRRSVCIQELEFDEDGYVYPLTESSIGLGGTASVIKTSSGKYLGHDAFRNSLADGAYPLSVPVTVSDAEREYNTAWEIVAAKSVPTGENADNYVSIQSVDKPGLYISVTDGAVKLTQDADGNQGGKMTFKTVKGLDGNAGSVSFESVAEPGKFLTVLGSTLSFSYGTVPADASFTIDDATATPQSVIAVADVEPEPQPEADITQDFNNANTSWSMTMGNDAQTDSATYPGAIVYIGGRNGGDSSTKWSISSSGGVDDSKAIMMTSGRFADGSRGPRIQLKTPAIPDGYTVTGKISIKLGSASAEVFYNDSSSTQASTAIKSYLSENAWTDFEVSITNDSDTYTRVIRIGGTELASDYVDVFPVIWGTATGSTNYTVLFDNISIKTTTASGETPVITLPEPAAKFEFEDNLTDSVTNGVGTLTGSKVSETATTETAAFVEGNGGGKAVSFSGAGSYGVALPVKPTGSNYTISFDAKLNAITRYTPYLFMANYTGTTLRGGDEDAQWIAICPQGWQETLAFSPMVWSRNVPGGAAWNDLKNESTNAIHTGKWQNITVAVNGASASVYVDGELAATGPVASIIDSTTKMYLGVNDWDTPLNGAIDNLILFNQTLNASQVALIGAE